MLPASRATCGLTATNSRAALIPRIYASDRVLPQFCTLYSHIASRSARALGESSIDRLMHRVLRQGTLRPRMELRPRTRHLRLWQPEAVPAVFLIFEKPQSSPDRLTCRSEAAFRDLALNESVVLTANGDRSILAHGEPSPRSIPLDGIIRCPVCSREKPGREETGRVLSRCSNANGWGREALPKNLVTNSRDLMDVASKRGRRRQLALATGATSGVMRRIATRRFSRSGPSVFTLRYCSP